MKKLVLSLWILFVLCNSLTTYASSGISLDGYFSDWSDKASLQGAISDGTILSKWYADENSKNFYFYIQRVSRKSIFINNGNQLAFDMFIKSDSGDNRARITYLQDTKMVNLNLYDSLGTLKYSAKGKWGVDNDYTSELEFKIPFEILIGRLTSGYKLDCYFISANDRFPSVGYITMSTAGTNPYFFAITAFVFVSILFFRRKEERNDSC